MRGELFAKRLAPGFIGGRRAAVLGGLAVVCVAACVGCGSQASSSQSVALSDAPSARSNAQAARSAATGLLDDLALPAGRRQVLSDPSRGALLARPATRPATPDLIDVHRFWVLPGDPAGVIRWMQAHAPAGARLNETVSLAQAGVGGRGGRTLSSYVTFAFPAVAGRFSSEELVLDTAATGGAGTALRADAQVVWVTPRPASERIPAGVREIDITRARRGQAPSLLIAVTNPERVREVVSMIDGLATVPPTGAVACPDIPVNPPVITLRFRATAAGLVLASASQAVDATAGPPCQPMNLSIHGRPQPPLAGGLALLRRLRAIIGVTLTSTS
ncbi:MAG: hypothetical protein ABSG95_15765 [Solirubrobacteraceae bacterium]|jgi:hypothetical protein